MRCRRLLIGARRSETFARQISRVWHDGLNERLSRALGRSLAKWAEHVEKRPEYLPIFVWLLRGAATDSRTQTILARTARSWKTDTAPRTAAAVLERADRRGRAWLTRLTTPSAVTALTAATERI